MAKDLEKQLVSRKVKPLNTLADKAYHIIEEMIVTSDLSPGSLVSEVDLCKELDIGRTPIREALQRLAHERLISVLPRKGMIVSELNILDQIEIVELRREVDRLIVIKATKRATPEHRTRLLEIAEGIEKAEADQNRHLFIQFDGELDRILRVAARNYFATQISETLHSHCRRFWYSNGMSNDLTRSAQLHVNLMKAVVSGNKSEAIKASDLLSDYVEEFTKSLINH